VSRVRISSRPSSNFRSRIDLLCLSVCTVLVQVRDNRYNRGSGTTMRPRNDARRTNNAFAELSTTGYRREHGRAQCFQIRGPANPDFLQADFRLVSPDSNRRDSAFTRTCGFSGRVRRRTELLTRWNLPFAEHACA
jgi:hypothetical protein